MGDKNDRYNNAHSHSHGIVSTRYLIIKHTYTNLTPST